MRGLALGLLAGLILILLTCPPSYACDSCENSEDDVETPELSGPQKNQLLALRMFMDTQGDSGWEWEDWEALVELWDRESNWRTRAANPNSTARGIPQAMMSLNPDIATNEWISDPQAQIDWGMDYITKRYGSPRKALEHHDEKGWY